jgi:hypothetical protein
LFAHDRSETRRRESLERQTAALAAATRRLDQAAVYALGITPGRAVLVADLGKLAKAAESFQKRIDDKADPDTLRREFATISQTWERAIRGLEDLKLQESIYLLRSAARVDSIHASLHELLGLPGKSPRLIIRT